MMRPWIGLVVFLAMLVCVPAAAQAQTIISGAGATFPAPLYTKWFDVYQQKTGVRIGYDSVGSGQGIQQILARKVDFGASDAYLSDEELAKLDTELVHIPTCLGAVAVIYHLPGDPNLRLTPEVLADIYAGRIIYWSDKRISAHQLGRPFPRQKINVVSRLDGSGTTFVFTEYLSKISSSWRKTIGYGKKVAWPVGMRIAKNAGVADLVARIPGSIGYVSLNYAVKRTLPVAALRNRSGYFIKPTLPSVSAAGNITLQTDARVMITDTDVPGGYPISTFTYLLVYREQAYDQRPYAKARAISDILRWMIHEGQLYNHGLDYAPLPLRVKQHTEMLIKTLTYEGKIIQ